MKQTALHQTHLRSKAKMTEFQGWQVPQVYTEAAAEYQAVRTAAGLFDVGFLGRFEISGQEAAAVLDRVFTRSTSKMADRTAHYGFLCNESGGIIDDALLFRLPEGPAGPRFLLTTNAINTDRVGTWISKHAPAGVGIVNRTESTAQFAIQGPLSAKVLDALPGLPGLKKLKRGAAKEFTYRSGAAVISRTGYTGEQGYELMVPKETAAQVWDSLLEAGREAGLLACGLATREVLRVEAGYLLYGSDLNEDRTPLEAGCEAFVDFSKEFLGRKSLLDRKARGAEQKLSGFALVDKSVPRSGASVFSESREIGIVTSGIYSPLLRKGIGLGYVATRYSQPGQEIEIEVRDREVVGKISELPFYRKK